MGKKKAIEYSTNEKLIRKTCKSVLYLQQPFKDNSDLQLINKAGVMREGLNICKITWKPPSVIDSRLTGDDKLDKFLTN